MCEAAATRIKFVRALDLAFAEVHWLALVLNKNCAARTTSWHGKREAEIFNAHKELERQVNSLQVAINEWYANDRVSSCSPSRAVASHAKRKRKQLCRAVQVHSVVKFTLAEICFPNSQILQTSWARSLHKKKKKNAHSEAIPHSLVHRLGLLMLSERMRVAKYSNSASSN